MHLVKPCKRKLFEKRMNSLEIRVYKQISIYFKYFILFLNIFFYFEFLLFFSYLFMVE